MLVGEEGGVTMADVAELQADRREAGRKGAVREMRRIGRVPCIVYGGGEEAVAISIEEAVLAQERGKGGRRQNLSGFSPRSSSPSCDRVADSCRFLASENG